MTRLQIPFVLCCCFFLTSSHAWTSGPPPCHHSSSAPIIRRRATTLLRHDYYCSTRLPFQTRRATTAHRKRAAPTVLAKATAATTTSSDNSNSNAKISFHWTKRHAALAVPALIGMLADPLLSLMDTLYVGRVGAVELAALGACTSLFHLAFNAFRATTTATTSLVASAQTMGERQEIVKLSLLLGVVMGLMVLVVLQGAGPWCLATMGVPGGSPLFPPAFSYLSTRAWAAPLVLMIVVSEGAFRGVGDTKTPLLASVVASLINLVLDPLLMFPLKMGVAGAAAATAVSQAGAASVYGWFLTARSMLPSRKQHRKQPPPNEGIQPKSATLSTSSFTRAQTIQVIRTILGANLAMLCKQGSLLLAWAYATAKATRLGTAQVAAHQVALSCWLVCALLLDGSAVSAQVLMSQSLASSKNEEEPSSTTISINNANHQRQKVHSLVWYMTKWATFQGLATTLLLMGLAPFLPTWFTSDAAVKHQLQLLMPHLAWQQVLVSGTLVMEALAIGGNQFRWLAVGTTLSTLVTGWQLQSAKTVVEIWSKGIVTLFAGRFLTAVVGTIGVLLRLEKKSNSSY